MSDAGDDGVPERLEGESTGAYYSRLMAEAPPGATVWFDEVNDEIDVVDWPTANNRAPEGEDDGEV